MSDLTLYLICIAVGIAVVGLPVWYLFRVQARINAERAATTKPTTPTRQRRQVRVVQRATMLRRLREQARAHDEAMARLTRAHDARWSMLLAMLVVANQPRPVDERRPVAPAGRVVEAL